LRGQKPTPASNLFSLAVLSYRMLVGSLPFPLTPDETFPYDISMATAQMEEIPPALRPLLSQCLDIKPANRFKSITEFLIWLSRSRESWSTEIDQVSLGSKSASPIVSESNGWARGAEPRGSDGEPVIQISPDWMEAEKPRRKLSADKLKGWFEQGKERLEKFLGPQPLKHNLKKQISGGVGVVGLGFILVMGVSSLFSGESKDLDLAKKIEKVDKVETTDSGLPRVGIMTPSAAEKPAVISAPSERLPMLSAAPGGPPEGSRAPGSAQGLPPVSEIAPSGAARTETSTGEAQPPKTTATRQQTTPAKAALQPASTAKSKPEITKKKVTAKDKKKEQYALLVSSYGKLEEANKMVAKLRQQGKQAVVRKSSQNKKTPYQVWISAISSRDQAEAAAKSIKTTYGVNSKVVKSGN
jgi:cell division septation protein DedD